MKIPIEELDPVTLNAILEEFVTRDGTEFTDVTSKVQHILTQLKNGHASIVYDMESKSCNIQAT